MAQYLLLTGGGDPYCNHAQGRVGTRMYKTNARNPGMGTGASEQLPTNSHLYRSFCTKKESILRSFFDLLRINGRGSSALSCDVF